MERSINSLHAGSLSLVLAASALSHWGCAAPTEESNAEDDVKKKVQPAGTISTGALAFQLSKPSWLTDDVKFDNGYFLRGNFNPSDRTIEPGQTLQFGSSATAAAVSVGTSKCRFAVDSTAMAPGILKAYEPSGLRIKYAKPLTVKLFDKLEVTSTTAAPCEMTAGNALFVAPGTYLVKTSFETSLLQASVAYGSLAELVRPTTDVIIKRDAIDPLYPTGPGAPQYGVVGEDSVHNVQYSIYGDNSVVPRSARSFVAVRHNSIPLYGKPISTDRDTPITIQFNRLEIDDVEVTLNGIKTTQKGNASIVAQDGKLVADVPTHTGVDLLDGTYKVVSETMTPAGPVTHTVTVSFP
jgi:hypothetical protein